MTEDIEDLGEFVGWNADAGIPDRDPDVVQTRILAGAGPRLDLDFTVLGEFDGVVAEVDQYLTDPPRIAQALRGKVGGQIVDQCQPLVPGAHAKRLEGLGDQGGQIERDGFEPHLAGVELGEIEDVVQDGEECLGR